MSGLVSDLTRRGRSESHPEWTMKKTIVTRATDDGAGASYLLLV
jgi:hypothetical protein